MRVKSKPLRSVGTPCAVFTNRLHTDNTDKTATTRIRARFKPMNGAGTIRIIRNFLPQSAPPHPKRLRAYWRPRCAQNFIPPATPPRISAP